MRSFAAIRHVMALTLLAVLLVPAAARAQYTGSVDFTSRQQEIDGFGLAATFARPNFIESAATPVPSEIVDQLFNPRTGVGITMLRMGLDEIVPSAPDSSGPAAASGIQIVTTPPANCDESPDYSGWDGSAGGEVWLGQQAVKYGVRRFYANSWSAPGYMKTNLNIASGGAICGGPGTASEANCLQMGDCRAAYANYLVQFIKDFHQAGVPISDFDWINEPTESVSYASMTMSTAQVIDFIHVLGPIVRDSGIHVNINCCDSATWTGTTGAVGYTSALTADTAVPSAASYITAFTGHEYGATATTQLPADGKKSWMSEWGPQSPAAYNPTWDEVFAGTNNNTNNGMFVANDISNALNLGGVSAYIWWYADSTGATGGMIQMGAATGASSFVVTKRLYALGHFARFVHPGAHQVTVSTNNPNLNVTAFINEDGTKVINVVNNDTSTDTLNLSLDPHTANWVPASYFTDENDTIAPTSAAIVSGTALTATLAPRSLTTITLAPPVIPGRAHLVFSPTLQLQGDGSYLAQLKVSNAGPGTAENVQLNSASLGRSAGTTLPTAALPYSIGNIAPGGFALVNVNFPSDQARGAVIETYTGTYGSRGPGHLHFESSCVASVPERLDPPGLSRPALCSE